MKKVSISGLAIAASVAVTLVAGVAYAESLSGPSFGTEQFLNGSGSGFHSSGLVFLGAWNGSGWCQGYVNFNADSSGNFSNESCTVAPGSSDTCPCNQTYTVYAYDFSTNTYSNGVSFTDNCPQ